MVYKALISLQYAALIWNIFRYGKNLASWKETLLMTTQCLIHI